MQAWTETIAAFVSGFSSSKLTPDLNTAVKRVMLDTMGCMLAGIPEPVSQHVRNWVTEEGGAGQAHIIGSAHPVTAAQAAWVNGTMGHALDFDDVQPLVYGHPSTVVVPAALAAAEWADASGADLIAAYIVGLEVMAVLGRALGTRHYNQGWHATATLGTIGAAAAVSSILNLDEAAVRRALGVAVSQAAGSRQNFGTMTKPLHAGNAARAGLMAAALAARGLDASREIIEGTAGFFALYQGFPLNLGADPALDILGHDFVLLSSGIDVKKYPCCFATHRAADAILSLVESTPLQPQDVVQIKVEVPPGGLVPLIYQRAHTGLEGKFCMAYVMSAALYDGSLTFATFTDRMVQRPIIQLLQERVISEECPSLAAEDPDQKASPVASGRVQVQAVMNDGRVLTRTVAVPRGSAADPLSWDELSDKFRDCAAIAGMPDNPSAAVEQIGSLESLPSVRKWMRDFSP